MMNKEKLLYDTIRPVSWHDDSLRLLDQRKLPDKEVYLQITNTQALYRAIKNMVVRGAPAIGIAVAYGAVLAFREAEEHNSKALEEGFHQRLDLLISSRPTAINLFNAIFAAKQIENPKTELLDWAHKWLDDDICANKIMGQLGAAYLGEQTRVLTHCNAGALATGGYGTALGVIRAGFQKQQIEIIYADETRPWNQGSRLTLWELQKDEIPATLIADSVVASLMRQGAIDWIIVGADSVCMNGDIVNKIGTYSLAVLAKHHGVKVMIVAATTTIDRNAKSGKDIVIEQRSSKEILPTQYTSGLISAINPVFDVTPAELISVIVTEKGVIESPDARKMQALTNHS